MENENLKIISNTSLQVGGCTYRKILRVDLARDQYDLYKSDTEGWQPKEGSFSQQLEELAHSGLIHPEDEERFAAFVRLENLRTIYDKGQESMTLLYRRRAGEIYHWNRLELVSGVAGEGGDVMLLVRDVTRERQQEEDQFQAMADRGYIISSLSRLFFSTYYIDVEQDTFRTVTQLNRVGDVLGSEVNCTAALQIYASHFIHPDDRAEYLRVMNVQNLRETLRWWKPYVEVEYRRLPEVPDAKGAVCDWVRATAVLARTGTDDLPKTVVYVAQNIAGGRNRSADGGM